MKTDIVALPKSQIARLKGTTGIRSSAGNRFLAEPLRQMKVHACNKASITVKFLNVLFVFNNSDREEHHQTKGARQVMTTRNAIVCAVILALAIVGGISFYAQWELKRFNASLPTPPVAVQEKENTDTEPQHPTKGAEHLAARPETSAVPNDRPEGLPEITGVFRRKRTSVKPRAFRGWIHRWKRGLSRRGASHPLVSAPIPMCHPIFHSRCRGTAPKKGWRGLMKISASNLN